MLFFSNLSIAFSDVIVDSLMVIQARDSEEGAEDLNTFSWTCMSFGGLIGSIVAAVLTENYEPRYCFLFSSIMGLVIMVIAFQLDVKLETQGLEAQISGTGGGFWNDFKRNCREIVEAFQIREFYSLVLYLIVGGLLVPSFSSFGYYFMLNVIKLSKFTYSMLTVLGFVGLLIGTQLFNKYLKEMEYRKLFIIEAMISIVMAPLTFMFVLRLNLDWGIPDLALIIFTDTVSDIIG